MDTNGSPTQKVAMMEVTCSNMAKHNLFRITTRINKGWILSGTKYNLTPTKGARKVVFDVKIDTSKGVLFCIRIKRIDAKELAPDDIDDGNKTLVEMASNTKAIIKTAHERLDHVVEEEARKV